MSTIEGIRKLGFRKWYERQLVEGHLYLVTMILALIAMAAGYEVISIEKTATLTYKNRKWSKKVE